MRLPSVRARIIAVALGLLALMAGFVAMRWLNGIARGVHVLAQEAGDSLRAYSAPRPLPAGSVVERDGRVVAELTSYEFLPTSMLGGEPVYVLRGRWLPATPDSARRDTTRVAIMAGTPDSTRPLIVRLEAGSPPDSARGHLRLEPFHAPFRVY